VLARTGAASADVLDQRTATARVTEARVAQSRQALAVAEADLKLAQAQRDDLMLRLSRAEIKARTGGIVSRRTARQGAITAAAADPLFRIIAEGEIELEADVPEVSIARLRAGQPAQIEPIGREGAIPGRVRLVSPEVNRATRLGRMRITVEDTDGLALGAFGRASVEVAVSTGVVVPLSAVLFPAGQPTVQAAKDGVVESRRVRTGLRAEGLVEIREGVATGEDVVLVSGTFIRNGDRVTPVRAERPANTAAR
jgi:RND family efflux transporter MFP subunit